MCATQTVLAVCATQTVLAVLLAVPAALGQCTMPALPALTASGDCPAEGEDLANAADCTVLCLVSRPVRACRSRDSDVRVLSAQAGNGQEAAGTYVYSCPAEGVEFSAVPAVECTRALLPDDTSERTRSLGAGGGHGGGHGGGAVCRDWSGGRSGALI